MSIKLYELAENYKQVLRLVESEEVDTDTIKDTLESIEGAIEEKAKNIALLVQGLGSDADIIKAEEKRLAERRKAIENKQKWLKNYLQGQMEYAGIDKLKSPTHTIALQKNPPRLELSDESKIPSKFLVHIPERYEVDKKELKEALKRGEEVEGAELAQSKSLRIR